MRLCACWRQSRRPIRGMSWEAPSPRPWRRRWTWRKAAAATRRPTSGGTPAVRADVRPLDMSFFQAVLDGYSLFHDPEYVEDRLKAGVIFGAFVDGRLAGFVGEHHEGSMGMLEVFPPYRGHGLGLALESFQINRYLSQGRVPFDQVIVGNEKSMGLQRKVGMELSKDTMSWLHRK